MTEKELSMVLKRKAVMCGLCAQWQSEWGSAETVESLIGKFKRGIDFCMENGFPGADFIDAHFDRGVLHKFHIYVNEAVELCDVDDDVVCVGNCRLSVRQGDFHTGQLYVSGCSRVEVTTSGFARFPVTVYDEGVVNYVNEGFNRQFVYKYGGEVDFKGNVIVRVR